VLILDTAAMAGMARNGRAVSVTRTRRSHD
jgi:hypothetical protein